MPSLRKIDGEDTARLALLISDRFKELAPGCDRNAIYVAMLLVSTLAVPAYEAALSLPRSSQNRAINDFLEMVRWRLRIVVLSPSSQRTSQP